MVLFGNVGQVQEVRERARHRQRRVDRHPRQVRRERLELTGDSGASGLRERAHTFHGFEECFPFDCTQRPSQQVSEQPDVVPQRLVRIVSHVLEMSRRMDRTSSCFSHPLRLPMRWGHS